MNAKWTSWIVGGTVLLVLSSQVMAQPWGGGGGRGQGYGRGQGMGRMGQGPGPMWQQRGGGPQGGAGAWRPVGPGPGGRGAWNAPGLGQLGFGRGLARQLGLTDQQIDKIQDIVAEARTRTMNAIKEVLTEEQAKQLDQMQGNAGQFGRGGRGPAFQGGPAGPAGPGFQQGRGRMGRMGPRGQGPAGQPFAGGPGAGWGMRPRRGMNRPDAQTQEFPTDVQDGRPRQGWNRGEPQGWRGQGPVGQPFVDGRGAGRGMRPRQGLNRPDAQAQEPSTDGQDVGPVPPLRRVPPIEQMFDQADTNHDGALTKDEIRAFHENLGPGAGWGRQAR